MVGVETDYLQRWVEDMPSLPTGAPASPESPEPSLVLCLASFRAAPAADENILFLAQNCLSRKHLLFSSSTVHTWGRKQERTGCRAAEQREVGAPPLAPGDEVFGEAWLWAHLESMLLEREMMQNTLRGAHNCRLGAQLPLPRAGRLQAGIFQEPIRWASGWRLGPSSRRAAGHCGVASVECPPPCAPLEDVSLTSGLTASVSLARPLKEPAAMAVQPIKV